MKYRNNEVLKFGVSIFRYLRVCFVASRAGRCAACGAVTLLCVLGLVPRAFAQPGPALRPMPKFQEETLVGRQVSVGPDDTVILNNRFGNVVVQGGADAEVKAELTAGGDSKKDAWSLLRQMTLVVERDGRRLNIAINCPERGNATEFQTNLNVSLPACALLRVENTYGDVLVDEVKASVLIRNRFGSASLHDCGSADVTNAFGDVNVTGLGPRVAIANRFGNVNARDLQGDISVGNENGILRLAGSRGRFQLKNTLGDLSVNSCQGRFRITSNHGGLTFVQSEAGPDTVLASSRNGGIEICLPNCPCAQIDARTGRGKIDCGLPGAESVRTEGQEQSLTCALGTAVASFELEAVDGDITIKAAP